MNKQILKIAATLSLTLSLYGCGKPGYSVLATTATVIGVEISQNSATQTPQAKLGYNRAEFAFVPTNRNEGTPSSGGVGNPVTGAGETGNVIMELRYGGIFDWGASSGIYQRLAVGTEAVNQPGASLMFAKNADGELDSQTAAALQAVSKIPTVDLDLNHKRACLSKEYNALYKDKDLANMTLFDQAAKKAGFANFSAFQLSSNINQQQLDTITNDLISTYKTIPCQ